jgi:peroxiredoxin
MDEQKRDELTVGALAPDFSLEGSQGKDVSLGEFRARANVVMFFVREFN